MRLGTRKVRSSGKEAKALEARVCSVDMSSLFWFVVGKVRWMRNGME